VGSKLSLTNQPESTEKPPLVTALERPRNEWGPGSAVGPDPLHHGRGVDRHHLPRRRPELPFLSGRTAGTRRPGRQEGSTLPEQS
jgi:hypothetical protein